MMSHLSGCTTVLCVIVCAVAATGTADVVPAIGAFDGEDISVAVAGYRVNRETLGWAFCATRELEITALGFIDIGGEGFSTRHDLGLWKVGGELLASSALPKTLSPYCHVDDPAPVVDPMFDAQFSLIGHYRYADIDPIRIMPGEIYVIGATAPYIWPVQLNSDDFPQSQPRNDPYKVWGVHELGGDIEIVEFREGPAPAGTYGDVLSFPGDPFVEHVSIPVPDGVVEFPVPPGFYGVNFLYEPVPEPASVLYLMCASATMLARRLRRR